MTPFPYSVDADAPIRSAEKMMAEHTIRHLPVKSHHELVGVVDEQDVSRALHGAPGGGQLTVRDIMVSHPYVVDMSYPTEDVLLALADHHTDCALVVKHGRLAGILTTTDVCRAFGEYLKELRPEGGDAA